MINDIPLKPRIHKIVRTCISIPRELHQEMNQNDHVNWSEVCRRAIVETLNHLKDKANEQSNL